MDSYNRPSVIRKSDLTDKMKRSFFQAAVVSILLYGCTTWTLTKRMEKKLDSNYTRMLRAILNMSWKQQTKKQQLYGHLPPITKTTQVRRTRHAGHWWRRRVELISDVLLWNPLHGRAKSGRPARTYIQQLGGDTGCSPEDLPEAINEREEWRERVRDIRADGTTRWRWCEITRENIISDLSDHFFQFYIIHLTRFADHKNLNYRKRCFMSTKVSHGETFWLKYICTIMSWLERNLQSVNFINSWIKHCKFVKKYNKPYSRHMFIGQNFTSNSPMFEIIQFY